MKTYFWDFFGPNAAGTAVHFQKHLQEFLAQNAVLGCQTGLISEGPGHNAVTCLASAAAEQAIERALRPNRSLDARVEPSA